MRSGGARTSSARRSRSLLVQIAAIALFYVALISVAVVERQGEQIALLRGRGSSTAQIVALYALEGLALGLPAILVAPFIAGGVTALLGFTPVFSDISGGELLPVSFEPLAFPLAALGALLSIVALTAPAFVVARRGPQGQRRALARPTAGFLQRYYLDVVLVGFALLALWELNQRDSVYTPSATGGVSSDPLLLASPALIIAAAAAVLARLYPIVLRIIVRVAGRVAGVAVAMGLWQLVRRPGPYTQLALLLMMAVAVGIFAASYTSTTERSYEDRARFASGVELRASAGDATFLPADPAKLEGELAAIEGVEAGSAVMRLAGEIATPNSSGPEVAVLGVSGKAGDLLWVARRLRRGHARVHPRPRRQRRDPDGHAHPAGLGRALRVGEPGARSEHGHGLGARSRRHRPARPAALREA